MKYRKKMTHSHRKHLNNVAHKTKGANIFRKRNRGGYRF